MFFGVVRALAALYARERRVKRALRYIALIAS